MKTIAHRIAEELSVQEVQVTAAIGLLDEGATVPFIARYRKEVTGGLSDIHLRHLQERLEVLRELEERRVVILKSIRDQEKLTPALEQAILAAETRTRIEDLYLPYRPKRRTKAAIALEAGLEPLALTLLNQPHHHPESVAKGYVDANKGVEDGAAALEGARAILMDKMGEEADLLGRLRETLWCQGKLVATVAKGKEQEGAKYADYFQFTQPVATLPAHRILAILRGHKEGVLRHTLELEGEDNTQTAPLPPHEGMIATTSPFANRIDRLIVNTTWVA